MNTAETPKTILIIEDQPDATGFIKAALQPHGYNILSAVDRDEAISILPHNTVDIILLDYWMPGTSASVFMNRLRTHYPQIKVIVITAQGHVEAVAQMLGVGSYLAKPFSQTQLLEVVRKCEVPESGEHKILT